MAVLARMGNIYLEVGGALVQHSASEYVSPNGSVKVTFGDGSVTVTNSNPSDRTFNMFLVEDATPAEIASFKTELDRIVEYTRRHPPPGAGGAGGAGGGAAGGAAAARPRKRKTYRRRH